MTRFFRLKRACVDCPFRYGGPIILTPDRRQEIADAIQAGEKFFCHKTVDYSGDEPDAGDSCRCFGAASVLFKTTGRQSTAEQIGTRIGIGQVDVDTYWTGDTYEDLDAFIAGRGPAGGK